VKNLHFPLLDPLRFAAALGVAVFHLMFWSWAWPAIGVPPGFEHHIAADVQFPTLAPFTWFGWVGVEIFFVISGFVIANSASKTSPTEFLLGRALRLYPAVWACATVTFIVLLLFASGSASEFIVPYVRAMLLIPKGLNGQWLDCIYWTLAAEMAFYGLVFFTLLTRRFTLRHLAWALTLYSAVFNAISMLVVSGAIHSGLLYFVVLMFRVPCAAWMLNHGCFFALGIWLFISANRELSALEQLAVVVACLSGSAEIYFFSHYLLTTIPAISGESPFTPIAVWAASVSVIAVSASRSRLSLSAPSSPARAGAWSCLRTLGLITYPLYLTHNIIGTAIIRVLTDAGWDDLLAVCASLCMLVLVCWFICAKIEPAIRAALMQTIPVFGRLAKAKPLSSLPKPSAGLHLPLPVPAKLAA
jgi:peptidoglycan/LPS O-acetylase OafA/YrhL